MRRVVVTGLGLYTSIGESVKETWENLLSTKSGINKITSFDVENLSCKIAGFISNDERSPNYLDVFSHSLNLFLQDPIPGRLYLCYRTTIFLFQETSTIQRDQKSVIGCYT